MSKMSHPLVAALALGALVFAAASHATDVAQRPLKLNAMIKPNVIFGVDNSGSMGFEVMLPNTNDGALWWDYTNANGWDAGGKLNFNTGGDSGTQFRKFVYLFPNGTGAGERNYGDGDYEHFAAAPTKQFAWLRSAAYNPLYYNPSVTYTPWSPAYVGDKVVSFGNADPARAKSHPVLGASTLDLASTRFSTADNTTFMMLPGMVIPKGAQTWDGKAWTTEPVDRMVPAGGTPVKAAIAFLPATYWVKESCTPSTPATSSTDTPDCALAPDGTTTLKRYEIRSGGTFPSGRGYAEELQNFANWYQYYRKRTMMLADSMGKVLENLSGLRMGSVLFNRGSAVSMYDSDAIDPATNRLRVAGMFYSIAPDGGTPTRETLKFIGEQYRTSTGIVQYACQRNNAFIVTDGFANASAVTPPAYRSSLWGKGAPYQTTYANTLADIALSYFTNNLRSDLTAGRVPTTVRDLNADPHMNTYGLTLGARGTLWPAASTPPAGDTAYAWPEPTANRSPVAVDDLWHATINGRGQMYLATSSTVTTAQIQAGLTDILGGLGAQSAAAVSNRNLGRSDSRIYLSSYDPITWSGDLQARAMDPATGEVAESGAPLWSASAQLAKADWTKRTIVSFNGSAGVPFTEANVGAVVNPGDAWGKTGELMAYLRGSRAKEGTAFRLRSGLLGAVINAEAVVSQEDGVVYQPTNEGMVHAFDTSTGNELWAYVPGSVLPSLGKTASRTNIFSTLLDGSPMLRKVGTRKLLIGGRGTGGAGYYALDVTQPKRLSEEARAAAVLWEFPSSSSSADLKSAVGLSVGKPLVVTTARHGTVALLTSGYNSTLDGKGRVFMLDASTGELIKTFVTSAGSVGAGDAGLAQLSAFGETDGTVRHVYGGDLLGNVWHFDLDADATASGVDRVAQLQDANGNPQPVTGAPELAKVSGLRVVIVGTGRLLGMGDFSGTPRNSVYAIADTGAELTNSRAQLVNQAFDASTGRITGSPVDWSTANRGWFMDLPAGQIANASPTLANGVLAFTANVAQLSDCSTAGYYYEMDVVKGAMIAGVLKTGVFVANTLLSRPVVVRTAGSGGAPGKTIGVMRGANGELYKKLQPPSPPIPPRKNAWKEVFR